MVSRWPGLLHEISTTATAASWGLWPGVIVLVHPNAKEGLIKLIIEQVVVLIHCSIACTDNATSVAKNWN